MVFLQPNGLTKNNFMKKSKFNFSLVRVFTLAFFLLSCVEVLAQQKTKNQIKEQVKLEKQKQTKLLVDSKEFVFIPTNISPVSGRIINLINANYSMEFRPNLIKSYLPFFGRAYTSSGLGRENGMEFEGVPTVYTIEKTKKNYQIRVEVKGERDTYSIFLSINNEGSAYLSVNSNNRSSMSYNGFIKTVNKK
jgi:hypothetical protein